MAAPVGHPLFAQTPAAGFSLEPLDGGYNRGMNFPDDLRQLLSDRQAVTAPFGPPEFDVPMVQSFGAYEAEYAAIRRSAMLLLEPQRAVLRLVGRNGKDFLHRLTTQSINPMAGGQSCRAFQLDHKGRLIADMIVHHGDIDTWLELDVFDIKPLHQLLVSRLFSEEVTIADWSDRYLAMSLHGPASLARLRKASDDPASVERMFAMPGTHHVISLASVKATAYRHDPCGSERSPGVRLLVPLDQASRVYRCLTGESEAAGEAGDSRGRSEGRVGDKSGEGGEGGEGGWLAYNTARIEVGTPLFHIDFGHDCLPAETGLLDQTVSFSKGCYLGQEIVARMQNRGHPKRLLVGLKMADDKLPAEGTPLLDPSTRQPVGGITSSAVSPLLGATAVALGMVKWGYHGAGTSLLALAEGQSVAATVQKKPAFL